MGIDASSCGPSAGSGAPAGGWVAERRGDLVYLIDGGTHEVRPDDWRHRLAVALERQPRGIVGSAVADRQGMLLGLGTMVVHPKGMHHLAVGVPAGACRAPEPCDALGGGVLALAGADFDRLGGPDLLHESFGTIELCLRMRHDGGAVTALPEVVAVVDQLPLPDSAARRAFADRWGFDPAAPDLESVRARHRRTGLLWNVRHHGAELPFEKYAERGAYHWASYRDAHPYRQRADHLAGLVRTLARNGPQPAHVLDVGCGDGLFSHLFAREGAAVTGVDTQADAVELATAYTRAATIDGARVTAPAFLVGDGRRLPCADDDVSVVALLDVIEHLDNPVAMLREIERVLMPGGALLLSTPQWQHGGSSDPVHHAFEFTPDELARLVTAATGLTITDTGRVGGVYRDLVLIARN